MQAIWDDLRFGARMLWKKPGFTLTVIFTLALGIGATTAIFSVVDAVVLRSLPFPDAERIVHLREVNEIGRQIRVAEPNYLDVRARQRSFETMSQLAGGTVVVTGGSEPVRVGAYWVTNDFFRVLGVQPMAGRTFSLEESKTGSASAAVISYGYWQRILGGRTDFSTVKLNVDGQPFTVVGVMPQGFSYPPQAEIWVPREAEGPQNSRTAHNWLVIGRLRPGVTLAQAQADMSSIGKQLRQEYGKGTDAVDLALVPLKEFLTNNVRDGLLLLLAAVALLLLVACANVANLLLAQVTTRERELSVRAALGATRWRMARQFVTENLVLVLLAGALGVLFSFWGVDLLISLNQNNLPRAEEIAVNGRVLLFTLGLSVAIAVVLGIVPLTRVSTDDLHAGLKEAGRGQTRNSRLRSLLVVAQLALTLVLLMGAGLLIRSFMKLLDTDPGFRTESAVAMTLSLPTTVDKAQEVRLQQFHEQLLERLSHLPGVVAMGGINALPMTGRGANGKFLKDDNPATPGEADYRLASGGYFAALGIPLLRGRLFNEKDTGNAPDAAVISQSLAKAYWPNEDPIGRTIQFGNMDGDKQLLHIVGIVGDIRDRGLDNQVGQIVYAHSLQRPQWWQVSNQSYVVRASTDPATLIPVLRAEVQALNQDAVLRFQTMDQVFSSSLDQRRFSLGIFSVFAVVALLLAAMGVYGVMSYMVSQRTRELGVRMALGAQRGDVLRLVLRQGMLLALLGAAVGVAASFAATRTIESLLYGVSATDLLTFIAIPALLLLVALLACLVPAQRATRVDPMIALRCE